MLMLGFLQWWYTRGWMNFVRGLSNRLRSMADFFSLGLLFRTFFSPFRQVDAYGSENASLAKSFHEFFDKLLSRIIGAVTRFIIIISGIITLTFMAVVGMVLFLIWPVMPFMPIVGIILAVTGVTL